MLLREESQITDIGGLWVAPDGHEPTLFAKPITRINEERIALFLARRSYLRTIRVRV
jgi:hypothetical protein